MNKKSIINIRGQNNQSCYKKIWINLLTLKGEIPRIRPRDEAVNPCLGSSKDEAVAIDDETSVGVAIVKVVEAGVGRARLMGGMIGTPII